MTSQQNNSVQKPIIIIGAGRSGTTVFYNLLSMHPDVCWFSNVTDKFPSLPSLSIFHRILDIPLFGSWMKRRIHGGGKLKIRPVEAGGIYHDYCGFEHDRKTTRKDVDQQSFDCLRDVAYRHCLYTGKSRFISKQTANNQRLDVVDALFPDAIYIHVIRDGRSVSNSLNNVRWWKKTRLWWTGKRVQDSIDSGEQSIVIAANHWKHDVEEILEFKNRVGDRFIEIKYEDLVADVKSTMRAVLEHCDLRKDRQHEELLPSTLSSMNYKWKEDLSDSQRNTVMGMLTPTLSAYGYPLEMEQR
jgi:omega-hydroxy-beta-dihydromenaquinone-9 sulfotransferase